MPEYKLLYGKMNVKNDPKKIVLGKFVSHNGEYDGTPMPKFDSMDQPLKMFSKKIDTTKINAPRIVISVKPYGSNDKVVQTTISMADTINKTVIGCLVLMADTVVQEASGPQDRGYEHYFKHLEKAHRMLPEQVLSMLREKFPGWSNSLEKAGEVADEADYDTPVLAWLCLPDGGSFYHPFKALTDYVIDEEQEVRFSLRTEKPKRPHRNRTNMTRLGKETRWFISDSNGKEKFQGEYENSDAAQSFILQLDHKNLIARILPIETCYRFEVSREGASDTVANALIEMEKAKKKRQEEHEMLWGSKDKGAGSRKVRAKSDRRANGVPLNVPMNRFTEALFGRRGKSKPKREGFSVTKKSYRTNDNVVKKKRRDQIDYDSEDREEEERERQQNNTEEFTGLLRDAGAEQWKLMEDLDYQYDRSDDDGDFGGEDNADNAEAGFDDDDLFGDDSSDSDSGSELEEGFRRRKVAELPSSDSDQSASESSGDSDLDVNEFLSAHSTYKRIAEKLEERNAESKSEQEAEPSAPSDSTKQVAQRSLDNAEVKQENTAAAGGKRKREVESAVAGTAPQSAVSQASSDGQKPAKRRKKVKKKKAKVEEVELNEENWLRILRENGGRMDFSKLLKHFRDIRGAQNKALVRSLRDRWCDEPVKVGKKHFIGLKQ